MLLVCGINTQGIAGVWVWECFRVVCMYWIEFDEFILFFLFTYMYNQHISVDINTGSLRAQNVVGSNPAWAAAFTAPVSILLTHSGLWAAEVFWGLKQTNKQFTHFPSGFFVINRKLSQLLLKWKTRAPLV